jgi:glycosyltransferase involved in cell wall biosynthesis
LDPDATVVPFRRVDGLKEALKVIYGTVRGGLAALLCRIELSVLDRRLPIQRTFRRLCRVAYVKTNLWFGVKAGGSVGHVAGVVNALRKRFERVEVLSLDHPPMIDANVRVHLIPGISVLGYPYELNYYVYQRQFVDKAKKVLQDNRPDLIYHRLSLANYAAVVLSRTFEVPLIVEYNGSEVWIAEHWGRPLRFPHLARLAEDICLRHADLVVTVSDVLAQELIGRGILAERVLVHPNCVDLERFDPERFTDKDRAELLKKWGVSPLSVICGFIGTFGMWHGITLLAETIRDLVERDEEWLKRWNVHFLLVGDGFLMPKVREILGNSRGSSFVTLTGLVEQREAPRYLAAADVLLSPHVPNSDGSPFFGSPTKLFEYMAMGKGIVASDLDQIGVVLRRSFHAAMLPNGRCPEDEERLAVLIAPGSKEELIRGIRFLIERPEYRRVLGRNARREALAKYTWEKNVDAVLTRLQSLSHSQP